MACINQGNIVSLSRYCEVSTESFILSVVCSRNNIQLNVCGQKSTIFTDIYTIKITQVCLTAGGPRMQMTLEGLVLGQLRMEDWAGREPAVIWSGDPGSAALLSRINSSCAQSSRYN